MLPHHSRFSVPVVSPRHRAAVRRFLRLELCWLLVACAALVVALSFQGARGLYATTEVRYAEVAREMLVSGNYFEPQLSGEPHWTKSPLAYTPIAISLRVFGINTWAAHLPNELEFLLTVGLVGGMGATLWDHRTGLIAALMYTTAALPVIAAASVSTDTLLTLWETAAMAAYLCAWRAAQADSGATRGTSRWWVRAMYACWGLAILTKGPVGLLPMLAVILWNRRQTHPVPLGDVPGLLLGCVIGASWYVAVARRHPELWAYFIGEELVARVATDHAGRNAQWYKPFTLYVPTLAASVAPWLALISLSTGRWRPPGGRALLRALGDAGPAGLLSLWLALPLAVFVVARSRLPLYVLPLCVPLVLATARAYMRILRDRPIPRRHVAFGLGLCLVFVAGKGIAALVPVQRDHEALAAFIMPLVDTRTQIYALDRGSYGIEFYLQRPVVPVAGGDGTFDELIDSLAAAPTPVNVLLVTKNKRRASVTDALDAQHIPYRAVRGRFWVAFRFGE